MSEIETMRAMLRQLINRDAPPLSLADMARLLTAGANPIPCPRALRPNPRHWAGSAR